MERTRPIWPVAFDVIADGVVLLAILASAGIWLAWLIAVLG